MKILFHINHPAQYHLFKGVIKRLKLNGVEIKVIAKNKDILLQLIENDTVEYSNTTHRTDRESNIFSLLFNFILQYKRVKNYVKHFSPDLLVGTSFILPWISRFTKIPYLNFVEDDAQVIPLYAKLSFSQSKYIITPDICQLDKWSQKQIGYKGYHELSFLHPNNFKPSKDIAQKYIKLDQRNYLIRFTAFKAHHDYGKHGIDDKTAKEMINILLKKGNVLISSEKPLSKELEPFRLNINPNNIHHVLAHCDLVLGDSQSMIMEAACLGIPSVRLNDYAGRISVLEEIEHIYKLSYSFTQKEKKGFLQKVSDLAELDENTKDDFQKKKNRLLEDKINVQDYIVWLLQNFPESIEQSMDNTLMQSKFGGNKTEHRKFNLKKGHNKQAISLLALYFFTIFVLYIIPLGNGLQLNRHEIFSIRLDYILHAIWLVPTPFIIAPIYLRQSQFRTLKIILLSLLIGFVFEGIHYFVPYRAFTLIDAVSNVIGVCLGSVLFVILKKNK